MATAKRDLTDPRVQGPLLTITEACEALGVSQATLYRYMSKGQLPFHETADGRRIAEPDIEGCKEGRNRGRDLERMRMQRRGAAHRLHALYDSRQITQPARDAFFRRFEEEVDRDRELPAGERKRRAEHAKKAYFTDLARRSSKARRRIRG